jgi:hypothetical protein
LGRANGNKWTDMWRGSRHAMALCGLRRPIDIGAHGARLRTQYTALLFAAFAGVHTSNEGRPSSGVAEVD